MSDVPTVVYLLTREVNEMTPPTGHRVVGVWADAWVAIEHAIADAIEGSPRGETWKPKLITQEQHADGVIWAATAGRDLLRVTAWPVQPVEAPSYER